MLLGKGLPTHYVEKSALVCQLDGMHVDRGHVFASYAPRLPATLDL